MIHSWGDHIGKRTDWSLIYFLIYAYLNILACRKFSLSVSRYFVSVYSFCWFKNQEREIVFLLICRTGRTVSGLPLSSKLVFWKLSYGSFILTFQKIYSWKVAWLVYKIVAFIHTWMIEIPPVAKIKRFFGSLWTLRAPTTILKVE